MLIWLSHLACSPPPPAPEGLDAVTSYMVREFYNADDEFAAGVQGFMNWFNTEGYLLVGEAAGDGNTDTFTLNDLEQEDVSSLPIDDYGQDLSRAKGVISLAEMNCSWKEAEAYLLRKDQNNVFDGDWDGYERTYLSDRGTFEEATANDVYPEIPDPIGAFDDGFDPDSVAANMMFTLNRADPSPLLGVDLPPYDLYLDFRHGTYMVDDEEVSVSAIITYMTEGAYDEDGENGLAQSYSVELNISRPNEKTLRALAVWAEPVSNLLEPDSAVSLNYAVNKSLASSERISAICGGEESIPAE